MRLGTKLGPRATILLVILVAASALGILMPTLSNTVEQEVRVDGQAITLTVEGLPASAAPGDLFRVVATMANNANRPVPAALRIEVRNPNSTTPDELTVYADWGAEEVVSSRTLRYYIGWNGPLLAAKGVSFPAGTSLATIDASIGSAEYWPAVLHEVAVRDPAGYASLISPGANASYAGSGSAPLTLKALYYYGMVRCTGACLSLADWVLVMPFSDHVVASGGYSQAGFLVEIHPASRGTFEFKFWVEQPDGLGIPSHPSFHSGPL